MSDTINYIININGNANSVLNGITSAATSATGKMAKFRESIHKLGDCMFALNNINSAFQNLNNSISQAIQPGVEFNTSITDLSAITGVTGEKLKEIGNYARANAKIFGGSAAQGVESYKLILSQLSPEISKVPQALDAMGKSVSILSKTMGGDTTAAAEVLTTAMNQFQVSLDDPIQASKKMTEMMNVMAAAAQAGSAEMPQIKAALENSGMAAKAAGVSFEELNAAIQVLDKAGKKGAEGGIAIRNALSILGEGRFMPEKTAKALQGAGIDINALGDKSKTLTERLQLLRPVMNDSALMSQIFGRENSNAGLALISGIEQIDKYKEAITGTTSAQDQANIVMGSFAEKMSRMKAKFDDWKISIFNVAHKALPALQIITYSVQGATSLMTIINGIACFSESALGLAIKNKTKAMWQAVTAQWAVISSGGTWLGLSLLLAVSNKILANSFKAIGKAIYSIPIVGWIAAAIALLAGLFIMLWNKSEKFRQILFGVWEATKAVFYNIGIVIKAVWDNIIKPVFTFIGELFSTVVNSIVAAAVWLWDGLVSVFTAVGQFLYDWVIKPIWDGITWVINGIGSFFSMIWSWVSGVFGGIADWFDKNLLQPIKTVFGKAWDFIKDIFDKILNAVMKPIQLVKDLWNKVFPKDKFKDVNIAYQVGVEKGTKSWADSQDKKKKNDGIEAAVAGISAPALPGLGGAQGAAGGKTNSPAKDTADKIASGGTRNTSIVITLKNLVEQIHFQGGLSENKESLKEQLRELLMQTLYSVKETA